MSPVGKSQAPPANNEPNHGATDEEMKQLAIVQEMMAKGEISLDDGIRKILELSGQAGILEVNSDDEEFDNDEEDDEEELPSHKRVKGTHTENIS